MTPADCRQCADYRKQVCLSGATREPLASNQLKETIVEQVIESAIAIPLNYRDN